MKTSYSYCKGILLVFLGILSSCEKGPEQITIQEDDSVVTVYAGTRMGYQNGPVAEAQFHYPVLIAAGPDKSLYIVEHTSASIHSVIHGGSRIRKISVSGIVSTFYDLHTSKADENTIRGITVSKDNIVFISHGDQIKKLSSDGSQATVVAGDGRTDIMRDGPALSASFFEPRGLAFDKNGCLHIMDTRNNAVRLLTGGKVTTLAGGNREFYPESALSDVPRDGTGSQAEFDYPKYLSVDREGNTYVVGGFFPIVRKITPKGEVAAIPKGTLYFDSDHDNTLYGITAPHAGLLYYAGFFRDAPAQTFRFYIGSRTLTGEQITTYAFDEYDTTLDGYDDVSGYPSALEDGLNYPTGTVIVDQTLYICNTGEHRIRKMDLD